MKGEKYKRTNLKLNALENFWGEKVSLNVKEPSVHLDLYNLI